MMLFRTLALAAALLGGFLLPVLGQSFQGKIEADRILGRSGTSGPVQQLTPSQTVDMLPVRERLEADRDYYVRSDGHDTNCNGLSDAAAASAPDCAFLTLDAADEVITGIDFAGYTVTMNVGAGSFAGVGIRPKVGGGNYFLDGAGSASTTLTEGPTDFIYNSGEAVSVFFPMSTTTYLNGFTFAASTASGFYNVSVVAAATVALADYDVDGFFSTTGDHKFVGNAYGNIYVTQGGVVNVTGTVGHTGDSGFFAWADFGSVIYLVNTAITLTGTPDFSSAFVNATSNSWIGKHSATITGAATGKRFDGNTGAVFDVESGSLTYFPGDVAGTVVSGAVYRGSTSVEGFSTGDAIVDENGNEQVLFSTTASAVNHLQITNGTAGTGGPLIETISSGANAAMRFAVQGSPTANSFDLGGANFASMKWIGDNAGTGGPGFVFHHDSATPAANDTPFFWDIRADDSGGTETKIAGFAVTLLDPTDGSEDGQYSWNATIAGVDTAVMKLGEGLRIGSGSTMPGVGSLLVEGTATLTQHATPPTTPNITSGAFTVDSSHVTPNPESGTIDTIVTISGGSSGQYLLMRVQSGDALFLDNGAGNLVLRGDAFLNDNDSITLRKVGTDWVEISRNIASFDGGNVTYDSIYEMAKDLASSPIASDAPTEGGTATINGQAIPYSFTLKKGNQTISSFATSDWFTTDADDNCAFIAVNGNLTIDSGQTLIPSVRKLCTVLYVTGNLSVAGGISMTARGANHSAGGSNVTAVAIAIDGSNTIPATCGTGGAARVATGGASTAGATGQSAAGGSCLGGGGGGSGAGRGTSTGTATSGAGATATAFSAGPGGGGAHTTGASNATATDGGASGAAGGTAAAANQGSWGGAGNPGGIAAGSTTTQANSGTAGTLIVLVEGEVSGAGTIAATGTAAGQAGGGNVAGGGGTGGGIAWVLAGSYNATNPTTSAAGGAGSSAVGSGPAGGAGGAGTAREDTLSGAAAWSGWEGVAPESFLTLSDTPKDYTGHGGEVPQVDPTTEGSLLFTPPNDLEVTSAFLDGGANVNAVARTLQERFSERTNVGDYNVVADCSTTSGGTDDTAAIQQAIDDSISEGRSYLYFPPGSYCVTQLDFTDFGGTIEFDRAFLIATQNDVEAVFDFKGADSVITYRLFLRTQTGVSPRSGVQAGRYDSGQGVGGHHHHNMSISGTFDLAGLYLQSTEIMAFYSPFIENDNASSASYAVVEDGANIFTQYSPHLANDVTASTNRNGRVITDITQADPAVVTMTNNGQATHGLPNDALVRIRSVAGMTEINSSPKDTPADASTTYCLKNVTGTTAELYERDCTTTLDTTGYSAYTSGGVLGEYSFGSAGFGIVTYYTPYFKTDDGGGTPLFIGGSANHGHKYLNGYFLSSTGTNNASVRIHSDHVDEGNPDYMHFELSQETGDRDFGFRITAESNVSYLEGLSGQDFGVATGTRYFSAPSGLNVSMPGFAFNAGTAHNNPLFGGGGVFTVSGAATFMGGTTGANEIVGLPDTFNGIIHTSDADDLEFREGSALVTSRMWESALIDYIPFKGEMWFYGQGSASVAPVRVATTGAGTLATSFESGDTIDGQTLSTGDRILIKNQVDATENGVYTVASSGAPTRVTWADEDAEIPGLVVSVESGTANNGILRATDPNTAITIGASDITFSAFTPTKISGFDITVARAAYPSSARTIASGAVVSAGSYHVIDTEAAGASDDLDTISGGVDGASLYVRAANSARTVVVKDGTGNIQGPGDCSLDNTQDVAHLIYDATLTAWLVVACGNNGA